MTKEEAMKFMVDKIIDIERDRLSEDLSADPNKTKKEAVNSILKELNGVAFDNEDKQN